MEIVGGAASSLQLVAYGHVVTQRLVQLFKAVQEGPQVCRQQGSNIRFLLDLIRRICDSEAPDIDAILPLLISTANIANSLLNLLQPPSTLYSRWLWISKGGEIEDTFRALNDKTRLLQLHISERTYSIVTNVQRDIKTMNQNNHLDTVKESQVILRPKMSTASQATYQDMNDSDQSHHTAQNSNKKGHLYLTANNNKAEGGRGEQRVANGWGVAAVSATVEANGNEKKGEVSQTVAEYGEVQEQKSGCSVP